LQSVSKIARTIEKAKRDLEREIERRIKDAEKPKSFGKWEGKKIVPVLEWNRILMSRNIYKLFEVIPNDYVPIVNFLPSDPEIQKALSEWYGSYNRYLRENKNPEFGKSICEDCILCPSKDSTTTATRKMMIKGLAESEPVRKFPCDVINIFKCPYNQGEDDHILFNLRGLCQIVDDALEFAYRLSESENQKRFEANFDKDCVERFDNHFSISTQYRTCTTEVALFKLRLSKVQVLWIEDIYRIITDVKLLDILLEQYINPVEAYYFPSMAETVKSEERAKDIRANKGNILSFFDGIKDKIRLEDISGIRGETLEEEKMTRQRSEKRITGWTLYNSSGQVEILESTNFGKCTTCNGFANVHCTNCNIWVCDEHWRQHKEFHDKKFLEHLKSVSK
jgi:hypothetical protein